MTGALPYVGLLADWLKTEEPRMFEFLEQMVLAESPSRVAESQRLPLSYLREALAPCDYYVRVFGGKETGGWLYARPARRKKGQEIQLLIGHCDTVWPLDTLQTMPFGEQNGKLRGPGIYDMKAGLTQIVFALRALHALQMTATCLPVVLINSDEEIGSHESSPAIRRLARVARRAYILEPPLGPEGRLKTARKGGGHFVVTITGRAAHAGLDPEKGLNAIVEMTHQVQKLFSMNDPVKEVSVNVGTIEGGISPNVVAPKSTIHVDVRVRSREDMERMEREIHGLKPVLPGFEVSVSGRFGRIPMERTPRNQALWHLAQGLGQQMGLHLEEGISGGGSDGNTTSLYTATLDGLGTTGDGAHAAHEYIFKDRLRERTLLLALLIIAPPLCNFPDDTRYSR